MLNNILEKLMGEMDLLEEVRSCLGVNITDRKGLYIELNEDEDEEELFYFVEVNSIDEEGCFEPTGEVFFVDFKDYAEIKRIAEYIYNDIKE